MQVQIRHIGGGDVSLDECANFSSPMGKAIDTSELLDEPYILEISSPGLSDFLETEREFKTFKGFPIKVRYRTQENSESSKSGLLHERSPNHLQINCKGKINKIPREHVLKVRLTTPSG